MKSPDTFKKFGQPKPLLLNMYLKYILYSGLISNKKKQPTAPKGTMLLMEFNRKIRT